MQHLDSAAVSVIDTLAATTRASMVGILLTICGTQVDFRRLAL
jgi:hypothetical protein